MDAEIRPNVPINGKLYFDFQGALRALKRSEHTLRREIGRKRIRFLDYGRGRIRRRFDIVCDDEGLFNQDAKISAIDNLGRTMLVGSLLVVNRNEKGETASLTDEECEFVLDKVQKMYTRRHPEGYLMLTQCEY